jgi:acyl carrier protein
MKTFNAILSEIFKIEESEIDDKLTQTDVPEWDSMNYIVFISELEKHFGITFSMDEVINVGSIGDLRNLVTEKQKK